MLGDTIDIKKDERRYNQLLNEGILPSAAIKRIENEKRLGIVVDTGIDWGEITFGKIAVVGLGLIVGYYILKGKLSTSGMAINQVGLMSLTIDNIDGIDLVALEKCRQSGLM